MHIRELERKTTVYGTGALVAETLEWARGKVVTVYRDHEGKWSLDGGDSFELMGYIHPASGWEVMDSSKLPVEFFNHQLRDCDPRSEESVRVFIERWGFPFLPLRNMARDSFAWSYQDEGEIDEALTATSDVKKLALVLGAKYWDDDRRYEELMRELDEEDDEAEDYRMFESIEELLPPRYAESIPIGADVERYSSMYSENDIGICDAISFREASLTIRMLQESVERVMDTVRTGRSIHMRYLDTFNMGSSHSRIIRYQAGGSVAISGAKTTLQRYSLLTSAICNQVIDSFADPIPWRDCACEGCITTFKRKQSRANAPTSDSIYCCTACEERQRKRNQRAAAKDRIRHY